MKIVYCIKFHMTIALAVFGIVMKPSTKQRDSLFLLGLWLFTWYYICNKSPDINILAFNQLSFLQKLFH